MFFIFDSVGRNGKLCILIYLLIYDNDVCVVFWRVDKCLIKYKIEIIVLVSYAYCISENILWGDWSDDQQFVGHIKETQAGKKALLLFVIVVKTS